ncbi:MAG: hypothetical protein A3B90_03160 [Candidatus Magasanikbacteria bacterium RIFCSPHIGHO2_02_FULL_41_13]|uniref:DUF5666 domain-containing protein n=1 Tax=Candidatus Magasanikbacteria bacterium RIFCSPHIGHO2_02_FULL_41_13 TaxID=1798676 RepID=A0A1F6M2P4_9BACT|nr:MAG: hypothetical protein A3B90_03160 [Candidatus Magasanikbacteria bacterium RIFCSPHIGHO2_02_FULL_41_13]
MDSHNHKPDSFGGIVLKVLLVVIIGGAIFGVGVCAGIRATVWRGLAGTGVSSRTLMNSRTLASPAAMMGRLSKDDQKLSRVFGTITKIEGNQITVLDNAVKNQIILSLSSTIITASSTEVGVSSLKVGQNIAALGAANSDTLFEAKLIQVQ